MTYFTPEDIKRAAQLSNHDQRVTVGMETHTACDMQTGQECCWCAPHKNCKLKYD